MILLTYVLRLPGDAVGCMPTLSAEAVAKLMSMVEDRRTFEPTESIEDAEILFIEDFDTWDMTGYYLYSKLLRSGVSAHIASVEGFLGCLSLL
jgi:hypothetical protein